MNPWKLLPGLAVIFLFGAVTGAIFAAGSARQFFPPTHRLEIEGRMLDNLKGALGLNSGEVARIVPILDASSTQLDAIEKEATEKAFQVLQQRDTEISQLLTPAQNKTLQQLESERRENGDAHPHRWHIPATAPQP